MRDESGRLQTEIGDAGRVQFDLRAALDRPESAGFSENGIGSEGQKSKLIEPAIVAHRLASKRRIGGRRGEFRPWDRRPAGVGYPSFQ